MKELSVEQKAQRYDEAFEKAKNYHSTETLCNVRIAMENLFPELAESEDERIREALIALFKNDYGKNSNARFAGIKVKDIIAWLEKQGEQKPTIIIPKFRVGDEIKTINEEPLTITKIDKKGYWSEDLFICGFDEECMWDLVGYNPTENKGMNLVEEEMTPFQKKVFCIIDTTIEEEQGLKQVCDELFALASNEIKQNSAEWSEDDDSKLKEVLHYIEYVNEANVTFQQVDLTHLINWLKSLRPKSQWKPSNEQMVALDGICSYIRNKADWEISQDTIYELYSLSEQLKKLREE